MPILSLWPYWSGFVLVFAFLPLMGIWFGMRGELIWVAMAAVCIGLAIGDFRRNVWIFRLWRRVGRFRTLRDSVLIVHRDPKLEGRDLAPFIAHCHTELERLGTWFGGDFRRRLVVYLFARRQDLDAIFGFEYGGIALGRARAILVAADNNVDELVPHELTHLFSEAWNPRAPELLREGLAVWLQGGWEGRDVHDAARALLAGLMSPEEPLIAKLFFSSRVSRYDSYVLAGSFTGFLIEKYGRQRYEQFYRAARRSDFGAAFAEYLSNPLEVLERQWREAITNGTRPTDPVSA